jgi:hypothetical protein
LFLVVFNSIKFGLTAYKNGYLPLPEGKDPFIK